MQTRKTATTNRQPVKTAARTTPQTHKAAPAKAFVRAAAPATRNLVGRHPECVPQKPTDEPCPRQPPKITINCTKTVHLTCIKKGDNITLNGALIPGNVVDQEFPIPEELTTGSDGLRPCITSSCGTVTAVVVYTSPVTFDSGTGVYSVSRTYKITDDCVPQNTAIFTFTVTFTVSDGIGPNINITPALSTFPSSQQCMPGTNPTPKCTVLLEEDCECECIFLPGCRPPLDDILKALGEATADGCRPTVIHHDKGPLPDGDCYEYWIRTFTATDECCNKSTKCRVVRYLNEAIDPTISVSPTIADLLKQFPGSSECTTDENPDIDCECIDLGCNPSHPDYPKLDDLIKYVLGVGTAHDTCGPAQICTKRSRKVGDCCHFSQKITWTAVDPCGNNAKKNCRIVIWKINTAGPTLQCASNKIVPCGTEVEDLIFDTPDAFDFCDGCIQLDAQYKPDLIIRDPITGVLISVTRYWSATDSCELTAYGKQTITVDCSIDGCEEDDFKGCSQGFWGNKNGKPLWDGWNYKLGEGDILVGKMPAGNIPATSIPWRFYTGTPVLDYFGALALANITGLLAGATMFDALNLGGGGCNNVLRQGVAALLNAAQFPTNYQYPPGVDTFEELYAAIRATLEGAKGSTSCAILGPLLDTANNQHNDPLCPSEEVVVPVTPALKIAPIKILAKPVLKKAVAPAPTKQLRKTFLPGNAQ